jgi:hypothetical protein
MTASRRNVLTLLGLAAVTTPAIATDDLASTEFDGPGPMGLRRQFYNPERMAVALERLAAEVRKGYQNGVNISRFNISSELIGDAWLTQTLTIDVEILHPEKPDA